MQAKKRILKRFFVYTKNIKINSIISYGDTLAKFNLSDLLTKHKKSNSLMSLVIAPIRNPFGIVKWNNKNKLTFFDEKPILNHFIGYAVIEPNIFKYLSKSIINSKNGIGMVRAIKHLVSKRLVNVYKYNGLQLTVNSVSELKKQEIKLVNMLLSVKNYKIKGFIIGGVGFIFPFNKQAC